LFGNIPLYQHKGGLVMNEIWLKAIRNAMEETGITKEELANHLQVTVKEMVRLLNGEHRITFAQLSKMVEILHIDVEKIMGGPRAKDNNQILQDDMEIKINEIARTIPEENKIYFMRAIQYLADLFDANERGDASDTNKGDM